MSLSSIIMVGYGEDVAHLVVFLADDNADYITSSTFFMDGC
ncbi:hypothetical protein [Nostoc sp.]